MIEDNAGAVPISGIVTQRVWDVGDIEGHYPEWSSLPREKRHALLTDPSFGVAPIQSGTTTNLVTDGFLEYLAWGNNDLPYLAFGDGTQTPAETNEELNNEHWRTPVGQDEYVGGGQRLTSTFLSQNEANGEPINEIGFVSGSVHEDWSLLTHTVLDTANRIDEKTSGMTATYQYSIIYG